MFILQVEGFMYSTNTTHCSVAFQGKICFQVMKGATGCMYRNNMTTHVNKMKDVQRLFSV